jgi:hypothetical protein
MGIDDLRRRMAEQEYFRRLAEGPLRFIGENEAAISRMQGFTSRLDPPSASVIRSTLELNRFADYLSSAEAMGRAAQTLRFATDQAQAISALIETTHAVSATIDLDRVGELIRARQRERDALARLTDTLSTRHADLITSFGMSGDLAASLPAFVSELPAIDMFVHTAALRSITPHRRVDERAEQHAATLQVEIATATVTFVEATLYELRPAFLDQYRGAKACAARRVPTGGRTVAHRCASC